MANKTTKYTPEKAEKIIELLSDGVPMATICKAKDMPGVTTVRDWSVKDQAFAARIAQARLDGFDALAAKCLDTANTPEMAKETIDEGGKITIKTADAVQHRKLKIWATLQLLSKWDPKRYGEKLDLNHSGSVGIADVLRAKREARRVAEK
jgi:hypothetical protein